MTHEITNPDEKDARRIYREIAFNRFAAMMKDGETIQTNVDIGLIIKPGDKR